MSPPDLTSDVSVKPRAYVFYATRPWGLDSLLTQCLQTMWVRMYISKWVACQMVEICESFVALLTGAQRFHGNVEDMIGFRFNPWLRICWKYVTPLFCLVRQAARNALWDGSSRIPSQPIPPSTPVALPLSCAIRDTAVSRRTGLFFPVPLNNLVPKLVTGGAGDLRAWERGFTQPPPPPSPPSRRGPDCWQPTIHGYIFTSHPF